MARSKADLCLTVRDVYWYWFNVGGMDEADKHSEIKIDEKTTSLCVCVLRGNGTHL